MTSPWTDAPARAPALVRYLDLVRSSLLSPAFRVRIAERERTGGYPFSLHNIYRTLFAAGPVLARGWLDVAERLPLTVDEDGLGTSLRCFRYAHALLVGADATDVDRAALTTVLEPIAARAVRMTDVPYCFCAGHTEPPATEPGNAPDVTLQLAVTLRQYADVCWLGQHDHGFTGLPPRPLRSGLVAYTRCFGRLSVPDGPESVALTVTYRRDADADPLVFDPFRGEVTAPPARDSVVACSVSSGPSGQPLTDAECRGLLDRLRVELRTTRPPPADGDAAVADLFVRELAELAARTGVDDRPWRSAIRARLAEQPRDGGSVTERYLDELELSWARWRAYLCPGD